MSPNMQYLNPPTRCVFKSTKPSKNRTPNVTMANALTISNTSAAPFPTCKPTIHAKCPSPGPLIIEVAYPLASKIDVREYAHVGSARMPAQLQCNFQCIQLRSVVALDVAREITEVLAQLSRVVDVHVPACSCPWSAVVQTRAIGIEINWPMQVNQMPVVHLSHSFIEDAIPAGCQATPRGGTSRGTPVPAM